MQLPGIVHLLRSTRRLTVSVVLLLSLQLIGNLYEELVSNVRALADPGGQPTVGELDAGSPLFFYLPWVPIGLGLAVMLTIRLHRLAPAAVARSARWAMAWLAVAVIAKAVLISQVNPQLRRTDLPGEELFQLAIAWAFGNGLAIVAVASALVLLVAWRPRLLDAAASADAPSDAAPESRPIRAR
jgi:hypothetical protein